MPSSHAYSPGSSVTTPPPPSETPPPILLYTNQWSDLNTFTGAYSQPAYKDLRQTAFYQTGAWIIDWSLGVDRDEWVHSLDRMCYIMEQREVISDAHPAFYCIDWESKPYPFEGLPIHQAITRGARFDGEAATFRYLNCLHEMQTEKPYGLWGAYGIPALHNLDWDPRVTPPHPMYTLYRSLQWFAPVYYYRNDSQARSQDKNLRRFISYAKQRWPDKPIIPHICRYNLTGSWSVFSKSEFIDRQIAPVKAAGADGCIIWDLLHKTKETATADEIIRPYLDAINDWPTY